MCMCIQWWSIVLQSHIIILHYIEQITVEDKIYTQFGSDRIRSTKVEKKT